LVSVGKSECALRLINHHLGSTQSRQVAAGEHGLGSEFLPRDTDGGSPSEPAGVVKLGTLALHPDLNGGLLGPAECATLARALRLAPKQIKPPAGCQLALRFPLPPIPWSSDSNRNDSTGQLRGQQQAAADADSLEGLCSRLLWHTDLNKYNDRKSFDFVVGVFLSPVRTAQDGALWVLPTSHLAPTPTPAAAFEYATSGTADPTPILTYNPVSFSQRRTGCDFITRPVCHVARLRVCVLTMYTSGIKFYLFCCCQCALKGDAIVFHRRMVHAGGPCLGSSIRYAVYYRMHVADGELQVAHLA